MIKVYIDSRLHRNDGEDIDSRFLGNDKMGMDSHFHGNDRRETGMKPKFLLGFFDKDDNLCYH